MLLDRLHRVLRAGWIEAALVAPPRTQQVAIGANHEKHEARHSAGFVLGELVEKGADFSGERRGLGIVETLAQGYDAIESGILHHVAAESVAHKPLHAVAVDGEGDKAAGKSEAQAGAPGLARRHVEDREAPAQLARTAQHGAEGALHREAVTPRIPFLPGVPRHGAARRRRACGPWRGAH